MDAAYLPGFDSLPGSVPRYVILPKPALTQPTFKYSDLIGQTPAPIQRDLLTCKEFEVGMITGFAAGKTRGICAAALAHAVKNKNAKVLMGRKTYAETTNTVKQPLFVMGEPLHAAGWFVKPDKWDFREGTNYMRLTNGSQIQFSNLDDPTKFRNEEYSMIIVDQAEEISEELWEILIARIRWAQVDSSAWQAIAAANDNGHNWLWRRFVAIPKEHATDPERCVRHPYCVFRSGHPDFDGQSQDIPCSTRRFFHGTTLDNKHNLSPRYLSVLLSHPPEWQSHFIYATMEGGAGRLLPDATVIEPFDPPKHWPRWRAIDHAMNSPCCAIWLTVNTDTAAFKGVSPNSVYVYREYYEANRSVDQHAASILRASGKERFVDTVIDRSTFQLTQSRRDGGRVSVADLYSEEGLYVSPSVGDPFARVERIVTAHRRGLVVSRSCAHVIEQMPEYYAEASKTDGLYKIVNKSRFHAVDALGYGLMVIPQRALSDADLGIFDERPDYLRRSDLDGVTKVHHTNEWKRIKSAEQQAQGLDMVPALNYGRTSEFLGSESAEIVGEYDPWGGQ